MNCIRTAWLLSDDFIPISHFTESLHGDIKPLFEAEANDSDHTHTSQIINQMQKAVSYI